MTAYICSELIISNVAGNRIATFLAKPLEDDTEVESGVTLEANAFNSQATEATEGAIYDLVLSAQGEDRPKTKKRPYGGCRRIEVRAALNKEQARALRDHINMFVGLE